MIKKIEQYFIQILAKTLFLSLFFSPLAMGQTEEAPERPPFCLPPTFQIPKFGISIMAAVEAVKREEAKVSTIEQSELWKCCGTYQLKNVPPSRNDDLANHPKEDPFFTGDKKAAFPINLPPVKFQFDRNFSVKVDLSFLGTTYETPAINDGESDKSYFSRRLAGLTLGPEDNLLSKLGVGGQSIVYKIAKGSEVLKFKSRDPNKKDEIARFKGSEKGLESMANIVKRDLAVEEFLVQAAKHFSSEGKPVVTVAKYKRKPEEIKRGILRQDFIAGESAFKIGNLVHDALSKNEPDAILKLQKIFGGIENAQLEIRKLETFFRAINADALEYQAVKKLPLPGGNAPRSGQESATVGIDYNHGINVLWDATKQIWVIFDW